MIGAKMHIHNVYFWMKSGLVLFFEDLAAHDMYQTNSPVYIKFIETHQSKWERVVVCDIEV